MNLTQRQVDREFVRIVNAYDEPQNVGPLFVMLAAAFVAGAVVFRWAWKATA